MFENYNPEVHGTWADWFSGIGTLMAIILSLYLSIKDYYKRLNVTLGQNFAVYSNGEIADEPFLTIDITNIGNIPVNIKSIGFTMLKRRKFIPKILERVFPTIFGANQSIRYTLKVDDEYKQLPYMLKSQQTISIELPGTLTDYKNNEYISKITRCYVKDTTGKYYYSNLFRL